jgi:hypothetical protein
MMQLVYFHSHKDAVEIASVAFKNWLFSLVMFKFFTQSISQQEIFSYPLFSSSIRNLLIFLLRTFLTPQTDLLYPQISILTSPNKFNIKKVSAKII